MPVLVTDADHGPSLRVALAIAALGGEVRATCTGEGDVGVLRAAGVFVSVGTPDDEGRIESALEQVHTVVHLEDPTVARGPELWASRAAVLLRAATAAGVRRVVTRSVPGADPGAGDALHAATGAWERALAAAAPPSVVLRIGLVDSDRVRDALASALPRSLADTAVAPVAVDDLVDAVVALDDARSSADTGHVVFHAEGATRRTVADHLAAVAPDGLVGRTWVPPDDVPLLADAVRHDPGAEPDTADLWTFTDVTPSTPTP